MRASCGLHAAIALVIGVLLLSTAPARAGEWGMIVAGTSVMQDVRSRYGEPTRITVQKVEARDSTQWIYEGAQAPVGMTRMTLDFGLLTPAGYRPEIVRSFTLQPKAGIFTRTTIVNGWGVPRVPPGSGNPMFFYEEGLLVAFDKEGWMVESMTFTPPQPHQPDPAPAPR